MSPLIILMMMILWAIVAIATTTKAAQLYNPNPDGSIWHSSSTPPLWRSHNPGLSLSSSLPSLVVVSPSPLSLWRIGDPVDIAWSIIYNPTQTPSPLSYLTHLSIALYSGSPHSSTFVLTVAHAVAFNAPANSAAPFGPLGFNIINGTYSWRVRLPGDYSANEFYTIRIFANGHPAVRGDSEGDLRIMKT